MNNGIINISGALMFILLSFAAIKSFCGYEVLISYVVLTFFLYVSLFVLVKRRKISVFFFFVITVVLLMFFSCSTIPSKLQYAALAGNVSMFYFISGVDKNLFYRSLYGVSKFLLLLSALEMVLTQGFAITLFGPPTVSALTFVFCVFYVFYYGGYVSKIRVISGSLIYTILSGSRSASLSLFISSVFSRSRIFSVFIAMIVFVMIFFVFFGFFRVVDTDVLLLVNKVFSGRLSIWEAQTSFYFSDCNKILGCGPTIADQYFPILRSYILIDNVKEKVANVHNSYIGLIVDYGFLGFMLLCSVFFLYMRALLSESTILRFFVLFSLLSFFFVKATGAWVFWVILSVVYKHVLSRQDEIFN